MEMLRQDELRGAGTLWRDLKVVALLMAGTMTVMANATISPALPGLEMLFADNPNSAMLTRLLVPAPSIAVVFCAPLAGLAADRFGRRRQLLAGVLLFSASGSAGLVLPDLWSIFVSRLFLGIAVAMIMTSQAALIGDYFSGERRSALIGLQVAATNFGGFLFITSAGWLALLSPRLPFAVYGLALFYIPFMWIAFQERPLLRTATVATPVPNQIHSEGHAAWLPIVFAVALLEMLIVMIFFMMPTQLPFYVHARGYDSAVMTGLALGALTLMGGCMALFYNRVRGRFGHAGAFALGFALMGLGYILLPYASSGVLVLVGAAAVGAGFSMSKPNFLALALNVAPAWRRGLASGIITTAMFLGQFVSPLASGPAISAVGYETTFRWTAALLCILLAGTLTARVFSPQRVPA